MSIPAAWREFSTAPPNLKLASPMHQVLRKQQLLLPRYVAASSWRLACYFLPGSQWLRRPTAASDWLSLAPI